MTAKRTNRGLWLAAGAMMLGLAAIVVRQNEEAEPFWESLLAPPKSRAISIVASAVLKQSASDVLTVWKQAKLLPRALRFLHTVEPIDDTTRRWNLRGALGASVALDAVLVREEPERSAEWTLRGEGVEGRLIVETTPHEDGGTTLTVSLGLDAPPRPDAPPVMLETFFGEAPAARLADDLRRLSMGLDRGLVKA